MGHTHVYRAVCRWSGSTGAGYDGYDRTHALTAPPATTTITAASDPAFLGRPELLNPEQLLVMAASSCQLLSFLAVAARARVDIVGYDDDAEGVMPEDDEPVRVTAITLRPVIRVHGDQSLEKLARLVELAHRECYIANSISSTIIVEPRFEFTPD